MKKVSYIFLAVSLCGFVRGNGHYKMTPVKLRDVNPGDHIAVAYLAANTISRAGIEVHYYHHAIYLDHREGVIHFSGDGKIKNVDILELTENGGKLVRIEWNYDAIENIGGQRKRPEEVMSTARFLLNNPKAWGSYDLKNRNCEHFASYCKTDLSVSMASQAVMEQLFSTCEKAIESASGSFSFSSSGSAASSSDFVCRNVLKYAWGVVKLSSP